MAISTEKVEVDGSAAVVVFDPGVAGPPPNSRYGRSQASVYNLGPDTVWLGGTDVSEDAFPVLVGRSFSIAPFGPSDVVYGICSTGDTADLRIFRQDS